MKMQRATWKKRHLLASLVAASCIAPATVRAEEFGSDTPFYEDDTWYDVTEWFDGNDYNPTSEAIGRWDSEVFSFADNADSSDGDNDQSWSDYGYADKSPQKDRWFYDFYDDGFGEWRSDDNRHQYTLYGDANDDGLYDSVTHYVDNDNDGVYEDASMLALDSKATGTRKLQSQTRDRQKELSSTPQQLSGTIESAKTVDVRGKDHLVAHVKRENGTTIAVDLGTKAKRKQIAKGDPLTAEGHTVKVGEKRLFIASDAKSGSNDLTIDRRGQKFTGKLLGTRTIEVRGQQHMLVKIETADGKTLLSDLGPVNQLPGQPSEGMQLSVRGVPAKVKDRIVLMAKSVQLGETQTQIKRTAKKPRS